MSRPGTLFILPGLLGEQSGPEWLCAYEIRLLQDLQLYFVENERTARRFLRKAGFDGDLNQIQIQRLDQDSSPENIRQMLQLIENGQDAGILSEAGMPALADPGASLIRLAHQHAIPVISIPGPSAIMLAIVSSGLNGQQFSFHGYLPIDSSERKKKIRLLEETALKSGYAQFFIETPYRNNSLLNDILEVCKAGSLLSIAANLTEPDGWNRTRKVSAWKTGIPDLHKIPVVFGIG